MKLPFLQFYPSDYMRDTRALSLAAKGGWMDVLCMLHGSPTRGSMRLPMLGWARVMGASVDQAEAVISEIESLHVADVERHPNGDVTLTSRRMKRESITREQTRLRVMRHRLRAADTGGTPSGNAVCNGECNAPVTDNKSETRNHIDQETSSPSSTPPAPTVGESGGDGVLPGFVPPPAKPANLAVPFAEIMELFNSMCPSLPRARLTDPRRKTIRARWLECKRNGDVPLTWFATLFGKTEESDFLSGRKPSTNSSWRCTFDWLMSPTNSVNVIEGKYVNKSAPAGAHASQPAQFIPANLR